MILNEKNKKPILTFGLGRTELTATVGQSVRVEQIQILNPDAENLMYNGVKQNVYGFEIIPTTTGSQEIQVELSNKTNKIIIVSNKIKLTVV